MANPWEEYQAQEQTVAEGPWTEYTQAETAMPVQEQTLEGQVLSEGQPIPEGYTAYDDPNLGRVLQKLPEEPTLAEQAVGVGETALTLGTGATTGAAGYISGVLSGLYDALSSGKFGTEEGAQMVKKAAEELSAQFTYEPKTEAGREYTQAATEALAPLEALTPMTAELGAVSRTARGPRVQTEKVITPTESAMLEAQQRNIPIMTTDIKPPRTFFGKSVQSTGEKIPLAGTAGMREAQQAARIKAIEDTVATFGHESDAMLSEKIMESLNKKRSEKINRFDSMKKEVIGRLSGNDNTISMNNTINAIDNEVARLRSIGTPQATKAANEIAAYRNPFMNKTISGVEDVRKNLGELFKSQDLISSKTEGEKSIKAIYGAVNEDMGNFIKEFGDNKDFSKWKIANKQLENNIKELESSTLKNILKKGDTKPEEVNRLLFSKSPSELKLLYKNLDKEGRNNAKIAIMNRAVENAGGIDNISPAKFKTQLNKLSSNIGVMFNKSEKEMIDGLSKALSITEQADRFAIHAPTGVQLSIPVGAAVLTDLLGGSGAGIAGGLTMGMAIKMYEKVPVRNALRRLSKSKEGTEGYNMAVESLMTAILSEQQSQKQGEDNGK